LSAAETPLPNPQRGTETIFVVEDKASVRLLARTVLERQGYRIFEAANGPEALRVWGHQASETDVLLTDIVLSVELALVEQSARPLLCGRVE